MRYCIIEAFEVPGKGRIARPVLLDPPPAGLGKEDVSPAIAAQHRMGEASRKVEARFPSHEPRLAERRGRFDNANIQAISELAWPPPVGTVASYFPFFWKLKSLQTQVISHP